MKKYLMMILTLFLCGCLEKETLLTFSYPYIESNQHEKIQLMNTQVSMTVYKESFQEKAFESTNPVLSKLHQLADPHRNYVDDQQTSIANLKAVNDAYGKEAVKVDDQLIDLLQLSIEIAQLSDGYFNPTLGNLNDLWKPYFASFPIELDGPDDNEVQQAKACSIPYEQLEEYILIDEEKQQVQFLKYQDCEAVKLDLGALIKGYAIEQVTPILKDSEHSYLLNLGESSTAFHHGSKDERNQWNVGIRHPLDPAKLLYVLPIEGSRVLSTSGSSMQYFLQTVEDGTVLRHHILNPYTGYSENTFLSITLIAQQRADILDALSTICFNLKSIEEIQQMIAKFEDTYKLDIELLIVKEAENHNLELYASEEIYSKIDPTNFDSSIQAFNQI